MPKSTPLWGHSHVGMASCQSVSKVKYGRKGRLNHSRCPPMNQGVCIPSSRSQVHASWQIKVQPSWQQELGQWFWSMPVLAGQCEPILQSRSWGSMVEVWYVAKNCTQPIWSRWWFAVGQRITATRSCHGMKAIQSIMVCD